MSLRQYPISALTFWGVPLVRDYREHLIPCTIIPIPPVNRFPIMLARSSKRILVHFDVVPRRREDQEPQEPCEYRHRGQENTSQFRNRATSRRGKDFGIWSGRKRLSRSERNVVWVDWVSISGMGVRMPEKTITKL